MISIEERKERIEGTTHIVRMEDSSIYRVSSVDHIGDGVIFVGTESDLFFQDLDVMTLEEAAAAERFIEKIRQNLTL